MNEAPKECDKAWFSQHFLMVSLLILEDRTAGLGAAAFKRKLTLDDVKGALQGPNSSGSRVQVPVWVFTLLIGCSRLSSESFSSTPPLLA